MLQLILSDALGNSKIIEHVGPHANALEGRFPTALKASEGGREQHTEAPGRVESVGTARQGRTDPLQWELDFQLPAITLDGFIVDVNAIITKNNEQTHIKHSSS